MSQESRKLARPIEPSTPTPRSGGGLSVAASCGLGLALVGCGVLGDLPNLGADEVEVSPPVVRFSPSQVNADLAAIADAGPDPSSPALTRVFVLSGVTNGHPAESAGVTVAVRCANSAQVSSFALSPLSSTGGACTPNGDAQLSCALGIDGTAQFSVQVTQHLAPGTCWIEATGSGDLESCLPGSSGLPPTPSDAWLSGDCQVSEIVIEDGLADGGVAHAGVANIQSISGDTRPFDCVASTMCNVGVRGAEVDIDLRSSDPSAGGSGAAASFPASDVPFVATVTVEPSSVSDAWLSATADCSGGLPSVPVEFAPYTTTGAAPVYVCTGLNAGQYVLSVTTENQTSAYPPTDWGVRSVPVSARIAWTHEPQGRLSLTVQYLGCDGSQAPGDAAEVTLSNVDGGIVQPAGADVDAGTSYFEITVPDALPDAAPPGVTVKEPSSGKSCAF